MKAAWTNGWANEREDSKFFYFAVSELGYNIPSFWCVNSHSMSYTVEKHTIFNSTDNLPPKAFQ